MPTQPEHARPRLPRQRSTALAALSLVAALATATLAPRLAPAQLQDNPVYLDDSLRAGETLRQIDDLLAVGSTGEAARAAQTMLDEEGDRLLPTAEDPDLHLPVREHVRRALLERPALLERYRLTSGPAAERLLASGDHEGVALRYLLTTPGLEAALRSAQVAIEDARFFDAVRTLGTLVDHPDRTGVRAIDAALLASDAASYLLSLEGQTGEPADDALELARTLGAAEQLLRAIEVPELGRGVIASALPLVGPAGPEPGLGGLVTRPLRSVPIGGGLEDAVDRLPSAPGGPGARGRPRAVPWTLPVVAGDLIYLADGNTVSAVDRFTLRPVWQVAMGGREPDAVMTINERARVGRLLEDAGTVAVSGDLAVAAGGLARGGTRDGDGSIYAVDARDGRVRWRVDPAELEGLNDASVRGPATIVDDTVIVTVRQSIRTRRLVLLTMLGLDAATGEVRWRRPLGSAGSLPFQQYNRLSEAPASTRGLVIRGDEIGVIAAIEASSGRPVWVRRARSVQATATRDQVYAMPAPLVMGDNIVMLSPDRGDVLSIDADTGAIEARRASGALGEPAYLVRAGDAIAGVGARRVAFVAGDALADGRVSFSPRVEEPGPFARAVSIGDRVLLPLDGGAMLIDPRSPERPERLQLARSGNAIALDGQLIVVDESSVHTFVRWEAASRLLRARLADDPRDADPAVTLAELAYHAGRADAIAPAVDAALAALDAAQPGERRDRVGDRLFDALMTMLRPGDATASSTPGPEQEAARELPEGVRLALLDQLNELARTPDQRVSSLLARGSVLGGVGDAAGAIEAYQSILTDRALSAASARASGLTTRADLVATRRLGDVLRTAGLNAYVTYERAAELEASVPGGAGDRASRAARYPYSRSAVELLAQAGRELLEQDRPDRAAALLARAMETQRLRAALGAPAAEGEGATLARHLARALVEAGRVDEASAFVAAQTPRLGEGWTGSELAARLSDSAARAAQLGLFDATLSEPTVLAGRPLEPADGRARHDAMLMFAPARGEVMLYRVSGGVATPAWPAPATTDATSAPVLISLDDAGATLLFAPDRSGDADAERSPVDGGGVLVRLDARDGSERWRSEPFVDAASDLARLDEQSRRPLVTLEGRVQREQIIIASAGRTIVLSDRAGRAIGYDARTGATLWARQLGIGDVLDAVVSGGALVAAFDAYEPGAGRSAAPDPVVAAFDVRTGQATHRLDTLRGRPRWLRAAPRGGVVAGLESGVLRFDPGAGVVDWVNTDPALRGTFDAWHLGAPARGTGGAQANGGERLYVLDADRSLWGVDPRTGTLLPTRLDLQGRLSGRTVLLAHAVGDRVAFAGSGGVLAFDRRGELVAADASADDASLIGAAGAEAHVVSVSGDAERLRVDLMEGGGLRLADTLAIDTPPGARFQGVALRDGLVLLVFDGATLAVPATGETTGGPAGATEPALDAS